MAGENPQKKAKRTRVESKKSRKTCARIKNVNSFNNGGHELLGGRGILHKSNLLFSLPCARNDNSFRIVMKFIS